MDEKTKNNLSLGESFTILKWMGKTLFRLEKKFSLIYLIASVLTNSSGILNTYVLAKILDRIITISQADDASISDIYPLLAILLGVEAVLIFIRYLRRIASRGLEISIRPKIEQLIYSKLQSLDTPTLENPETSNKVTRARNEIFRLSRYYEDCIQTVGEVVSLLITLVIISINVPIVPVILVLAYIPRFINDVKYRKLAWKFGYDNTENLRRAQNSAWNLSHVPYIKEIQINNAKTFLENKFITFTKWWTKEAVKIRQRWFSTQAGFDLFNSAGVYAGYLFVLKKLVYKTISVGDVYFQIRIIDKLQRDLTSSTSRISNISEFLIRLKDTYELFHQEPSIKEGSIEINKLQTGPQIDVRNLHFHYPNNEVPVLSNINLSINRNEKVAIVGPNGAGKTTLLKLICRMYLPTKGSILINGDSIEDINSKSLYNNIGILFQDYNQYDSLTVKENVLIGRSEDGDESTFLDAIKNAEALDFINELPNKFDQVPSERYKGGIRLSTGQWQKLAIARFFYRNAPLVIFDEPTASIDPESEYNIFNKIYGFFENKTVIIVSHRFSTVRNADRIIVLDKGRIVEQGSHKELMKKDGRYARAFNLQAEAYNSD